MNNRTVPPNKIKRLTKELRPHSNGYVRISKVLTMIRQIEELIKKLKNLKLKLLKDEISETKEKSTTKDIENF